MSKHLNRRQDFDWDFDQYQAPEKSPKYQDFNGLDSRQAKLEELAFFTSLALFCVTAVLLSFLFLVFNLATLIALPLAVVISATLSVALYRFLPFR